MGRKLRWLRRQRRKPHRPALPPSRPYSENEVPQPQEGVAWGFSVLNDCLMRSSTKSTTEPSVYCSETSSARILAPSFSTTRSSACRVRSTSKPEENPEQPPPL